jgi:hypothetical protein
MTQPAQLITPQGEKIELPPYIYAQVMEMLSIDQAPRKMTHAEIQTVIQKTRGKYARAGGKPMTQVLLEMRAEDRARERKKDAEIAKRFFSKRTKSRKTRVRPG